MDDDDEFSADQLIAPTANAFADLLKKIADPKTDKVIVAKEIFELGYWEGWRDRAGSDDD